MVAGGHEALPTGKALSLKTELDLTSLTYEAWDRKEDMEITDHNRSQRVEMLDVELVLHLFMSF